MCQWTASFNDDQLVAFFILFLSKCDDDFVVVFGAGPEFAHFKTQTHQIYFVFCIL